MQKETFNTIASFSEGLYKDKGSKFIAYAYPITSIEEVKPIVDKAKKQHPSARHHCWAYRIGCKQSQYRAYDDGEPSHTAGTPILGQIDSFELTNIIIVVIRYFGGTLLGVGGLIQAYREAAKDALLQSNIITQTIQSVYSIEINYEQSSMLMQKIKQFQCTILSQQFEMICNVICSIALSKSEQFLQQISLIPSIKITEQHG